MSASVHRHVIWDWNGTLFNDAWLCVDVMNGLLGRRGLPLLTPARYQQVFDFPVVNYYRRLGFDFEQESFEALGTEFMADYERRRLECSLQPGALDVLGALAERGVTQSVLSAYRHDTLEEVLRHFGVRAFFTQVIGADDHYAGGKLDRGRQWIRDAGLDPREVVLVGDTVHDFDVATAMGTACWLVPGGNHPRERLAACGVPVFDSLAEVGRAIAGEGGA